MIKEHTSKDQKQPHYFTINSGNGQVVATSETYQKESGMKKGQVAAAISVLKSIKAGQIKIPAKYRYLLGLFVFLSCNIMAQPFVGVHASTIGVGLTAGMTEEQFKVETGYQVPLNKANKPSIFHVAVGYQIPLEESEINITPSIGMAWQQWKDFTMYESHRKIVQVKQIKPRFNVEFGRDWHTGRVYIGGTCTDRFFFTVGIKAFFQ